MIHLEQNYKYSLENGYIKKFAKKKVESQMNKKDKNICWQLD